MFGYAAGSHLSDVHALGTRRNRSGQFGVTTQVLFDVGGEQTQWRPFRAGVLLRQFCEFWLIEAENDFVLSRDNRNALLTASADHFPCGVMVGSDILFDVGDVVCLQVLLGAVTPGTGSG